MAEARTAATLPVPPSALRLRLDLEALAENWRALDRMSGVARAGAAVKADAYGLGAAQVVPVLERAGCRDWFVAHWQEAAALLGLVPAERIAVLHGPADAAEAAYARETGLRPVLNSLAQARIWREAGGGTCHVMVDTGMNRLGLSMDDLGDPVLAGLAVDLGMSHLASADEDSPMNAQQLARFRAAAGQLGAGRLSLANSAGVALGADYRFDLTRPGIALYGGVPRAEFAGVIRQVACPEAAVIQTRMLDPGDTVGYNATFIAPRAMRIGIAAVGYADGFLRCRGGSVARFGMQSLAVVGRISMDMIALDLSGAPSCREGSWITLDYDLPRAAAQSGLSQYELLTVLGRRFAR